MSSVLARRASSAELCTRGCCGCRSRREVSLQARCIHVPCTSTVLHIFLFPLYYISYASNSLLPSSIGPLTMATKNYDFSWTRKPAIDLRKDVICCSEYSIRRQPCSQDLDGYVAPAARSSMSHPAAFLSPSVG